MLEGLVAWVLNTYIGEYVENLNTDKLSVGILQGQVNLSNLPLRKDALRNLDLPLEVKSGFIGHISLSVPLRRVRSEPWVITLEKLYLVAGPLKEVKYEKEKRKKQELDRKKAVLSELEEKWKARRLNNQVSSESWWSYGTSLVTNIVENLQLNVKDVHLRYEDDQLMPACPFAVGVVIKSLSAQSTNSNWVPQFVSRWMTDMMHKLLELQDFSVYLDTHCKMLGDLPLSELEDALQRPMYESSVKEEMRDHEYIVQPVSAQAKMRRNTSALALRGQNSPRIALDVEMDTIPFALSQAQYRCMIEWVKAWKNFEIRRQFWQWRPVDPVKEKPRDWWQFAINSMQHNIHEKNRRATKEYMLQRARDIVAYVDSYSDFLRLGEKYMEPAKKTLMHRVEEEWALDEIQIAREIVTTGLSLEDKLANEIKASDVAIKSPDSTPEEAKSGLLRGWFPGWSGWGWGGSPEEGGSAPPTPEEPPLEETEFEQEILDVLHTSTENDTLLKRDTVFAQVDFCLKGCSVKLLHSEFDESGSQNSKCFIELECSTVQMGLESRPRTHGLKFMTSVGGLYLRDMETDNSIMPVLIAPQTKERTGFHSHLRGGLSGRPSSLHAGGILGSLTSTSSAEALKSDTPLFEFLYEKKPTHSNADYRLEMKTQPLDIVYNMSIIKSVRDFFVVRKSDADKLQHEIEIAAAAKSKYEELKQQTQNEFKQTIDELLEGDNKVKAKRWQFNLDISAPQFILPDTFTDKNATLVVFDLGRLQLYNVNAELNQPQAPLDPQMSIDEEDDFVTPSSTPPSETELTPPQDKTPTEAEIFSSDLTEAALRDKIYDKYVLKLSEMQVMVGRARDNWRHAHYKGTSHIHVMDKLNMSLQLDRRLLYTSDPEFPKITISGSLPSLVLHVNEQKIQALRNCATLLGSSAKSEATEADAMKRPENVYRSMYSAYNKSVISLSEPEVQRTKQSIAESRLLLSQFIINQVSLQFQSRGRSIAELQVSGVRANFTRRPHDTSVSFSVHSLLVVDAVQTFGPDFELLVASHKNLCLDTLSGSIRDSDPSSPVSPQSPLSPSSPAEPVKPPPSLKSSMQNVQTAVSNALQSLISSRNVSTSSDSDVISPFGLPGSPTNLDEEDTEALISMELDMITPGCPTNTSGETVYIGNLQFNNLDFIANQRTLMELMAFFKRVFPTAPKSSLSPEPKEPTLDRTTTKTNDTNDVPVRWELTADFHRLNVLLMRVEGRDASLCARKVATATLLDARIQATIAEEAELEGSLGGLQLLDLSPDHRRHQRVFSVGIGGETAPQSPTSSDLFSQLRSTDLYRTTNESLMMDADVDKAFTFTLRKSLQPMSPGIGQKLSSSNDVNVTLRLASMCYTHVPLFLLDLSECVTEFKDYMSRVGSSIRTAATEMAMGLVQQPAKTDVASFYGSELSIDDLNRYTNEQESTTTSMNIILDAVLQTPVLMLPRKANSSEVLVAHLGKILIKNSKAPDFNNLSSDSFCENKSNEKVHIEVRDMSLYSVNMDKQCTLSETAKTSKQNRMSASVFSTPQPGGATSKLYGFPILHNTVIEMVIEKIAPEKESDIYGYSYVDNLDFGDDFPGPQPPKVNRSKDVVLLVTGKVINALKLGLSKQVFEQILQTLDNLAPEPTANEQGESENTSQEADAPSTPQGSDKAEVAIHSNFEMPSFEVNMVGDLGEGERGLVNLNLEDFQIRFQKNDKWTKAIDLSLHSLVIEDLLQDPDSLHRKLMVSLAVDKPRSADNFNMAYLSQSCPSSMIDIPMPSMPGSLPSDLNQTNVFFGHMPAQERKMKIASKNMSVSGYPCTPPSSPLLLASPPNESDTRLVHMKILLVDKKCPEFASKYNKTNRYVDVDFNCLNTTVNLQTWVVLLDFLGLGAKVHDPDQFTKEAQMARSQSSPEADFEDASTPPLPPQYNQGANNEVRLKVKSLALILNKQEYELAKVSISNVNLHVAARDSTLAVKGQLGSLSLLDQSPHGNMYRERFITTGAQALDIDFFKHGLPDPDLLREHDIRVKLRMSSVWYVHTQRFIMEILAFVQHFNQLQDILGRMRAASDGKKITEKASRAPCIALDIEAGAPVILIPHSSRTTDILVMDLGTLTVSNTFKHDGDPGTTSRRRSSLASQSPACSGVIAKTPDCLVQENTSPEASTEGLNLFGSMMSQSVYGSLNDDWRSNQLESSSSSFPSLNGFLSALGSGSSSDIGGRRSLPTISHHASSPSPLSPDPPPVHHCLLDVMQVTFDDIDLFSAEWRSKQDYEPDANSTADLIFPSFVVQRESGKLMKETCKLQVQVERNLEGDISHSVPDFSIDGKLSSVHFSLDLQQYKLVRGLLAHNFGEPLEEFQRPLMANLKDPKIETVLSGEAWKSISITVDLEDVTTELLSVHGNTALGIKEKSLAKFNFITSRLSFESYSNGCKDIDLVSHEIRVLDTRYTDNPINMRPNVFSDILRPSCQENSGQERGALQMELHFRVTKEFDRFTILLNNMRIMGIFDWLLSCKDFILTGPLDPFKGNKGSQRPSSSSPGLDIRPVSPVEIAGGIVTKRAPVIKNDDKPFEIRLNVTDTELIVVEDTKDRDTNAVILKTTAVLSYRPTYHERPISCSLQSLEVFSCSLAAENETALSIIDPMIVTIELNGSPMMQQKTHGGPAGLADATSQEDKPPVVEISFSSLNVRLSYNDMQLFLAIMHSMPKQLIQASQQSKEQPKNAANAAPTSPTAPYPDWQIKQLSDLGYQPLDCQLALTASHGQLDDAALWLTHNASPRSPSDAQPAEPVKKGLQVSGFEIKAGAICLCLIDDCQDADIPLAELSISQVHLLHHVKNAAFKSKCRGSATFKLTGDYYNRGLSGWEPFIETWGSSVVWEQGVIDDEDKWTVSIKADEVLNLNVTNSFMELLHTTKAKWTEDYMKRTNDDEVQMYNSRKRVPFVPFVIKNDTGCLLHFATVTSSPTRAATPGDASLSQRFDSEQRTWRAVLPGDEFPFMFEEREKFRHKQTHELKVHQLVVCVDGWKEVSAISVDRVGVFFRQAVPDIDVHAPIFADVPPARIVFDVSRIGSARKLITVRSALLLSNQLADDVEVQLENALPHINSKVETIVVKSKCTQALPLSYVHARTKLRPSGWSLDWCNKPILWSHIKKPGEYNDSTRTCDTIGAEKDTYRFCVSVYRQLFPVEPPPPKSSTPSMTMRPVLDLCQPGHVITLVPPVQVENLLPVDMQFVLRNSVQDSQALTSVKPGKSSSSFTTDLSREIRFRIHLENFHPGEDFTIPVGIHDQYVNYNIKDFNDQLLELKVVIHIGIGGALKIYVAAPYWLVNKTGLPIIFKQEGGDKPAAGQYEEHEIARSVLPLLFSYSDKERHQYCVMRLGKGVHGSGTVAKWSSKFSLDRGTGVMQLYASPHDSRPDWVYNIGIDVRLGRGRYCLTHIITFAPRFLLDNRSRHKLAFAQRHIAQGYNNAPPGEYISAISNSSLSFHWPRVDLDQLLCVRLMDNDKCKWSGGFRIDRIDSFHVNMRGENNDCLFLRVDIMLQQATFFIVFSNAHDMPPPYRIDNFSEVPITYFQTKVLDDSLRTQIKPRTSLPYSLDEIILPPHITLKVSGGSSATYNLNQTADGDQLTYENFIYIAFTGTFNDTKAKGTQTYSSFVENQQLVLDVIAPNRVVLKAKEAGKRSQFWRMTSLGMLQHEGSSAPREPRKASSKPTDSNIFVLDIQDLAPQPTKEMMLTLKKPDERRHATQTWHFTKDGRLCCAAGERLCVQAKDGMFGLRDGGEAVLGPCSLPPSGSFKVPYEMAIHRQKLRPGSGFLSVCVVTDGPTRVLQINDINRQRYSMEDSEGWLSVKENKRPRLTSESQTSIPQKLVEFDVAVHMKGGLGVSLVNRQNQEIIYISLQGIHLDYGYTQRCVNLEMTVDNIQVDNQIFGNNCPVLVYVTPLSRSEAAQNRQRPALSISATKLHHTLRNAEIFQHLIINLTHLTTRIEEVALWKLLEFLGFGKKEIINEDVDENSYESQRALTAATSTKFKRYYFGTLKVLTGRVTLSVLTASDLDTDLAQMKHKVGIPLAKFEDVKVELDPFMRIHPFETSAFILDAIKLHYTEELKSQAAKILGSVDFLGNPLGLVNDVAAGVSGLIIEGNVGGLFKSITHGISNSAAKVTGTLSDGVGVATLDSDHQRRRQKIRMDASGSGGSDHLFAGIKGFGHGMVGGFTSIITQPYQGAKEEGFGGFFKGLGIGALGTVTKPVAGVLDLASGAANAVRDSSRSGSSVMRITSVRPARCCSGPGGLLPMYSIHHAKAQEYLFSLNDSNYKEMFVALEQLRFGKDDSLRVLISSEAAHFLGRGGTESEPDNIVLQVPYQELFHCRAIPNDQKFYVELTMKADPDRGVSGPHPKKAPLVRCDSESIAQKVVQQINYAKNLHDESKQTLSPDINERGIVLDSM